MSIIKEHDFETDYLKIFCNKVGETYQSFVYSKEHYPEKLLDLSEVTSNPETAYENFESLRIKWT